MHKKRVAVGAVTALLVVAVIVYMAIYIVQALSSPFDTAEAVFASVEVTVPVGGWFARDEVLVVSSDTTGAVSETVVPEGSKVARGQELIVYYDSPEAAGVHRELDALEEQIAQLEHASSGSGISDISKTDSRLVEVFAAFAHASSTGNFSALAREAGELKSLVLKRDYTSGRYDSDDMTALLDTLNARRDELRLRQSGVRAAVRSQHSGYFSSSADGYENVLTMDSVLDLSVSDVKNLSARKENLSAAARGKLSTSFGWRYVTLLAEEDASRLTVNKWVTLRFNGDFVGEVDVRVLQISEPQDGECAVTLSCSTLIGELLQYRRMNAEIVLESYDGVRIPKASLRVGEEGANGVYVLEAMQAKFVKVNIIRETEGFYLVEFVSDSSTSIRPGDEIITNSKNLYDGKIIE